MLDCWTDDHRFCCVVDLGRVHTSRPVLLV